MVAILMIFKINPFFTIVGIEISPLEKIMAFGAVATGSIKAHEAESVVASISKIGSWPLCSANAPIIGNIKEAVATLEVISVIKLTTVTINRTRKGNGKFPQLLN